MVEVGCVIQSDQIVFPYLLFSWSETETETESGQCPSICLKHECYRFHFHSQFSKNFVWQSETV